MTLTIAEFVRTNFDPQAWEQRAPSRPGTTGLSLARRTGPATSMPCGPPSPQSVSPT